ncbi:Gfo/Idh/MocA family protein [Natronospora cellulosivora (SeqCode)]
MNEQTKVLIVGIGGYGSRYVNTLLDGEREDYDIVGVVDPYPDNCPRLDEIKEKEIPVFLSLEEFYKENTADYVCISSPIQYHCPQTIMALEKGAGVLCEKPLAATVEAGEKILATQQETGKPVGIGYQWSYSQAIQDLKKDILDGVLGKAIRLKTMILWPRDFNYYNRSAWAGKIKDQNGNFILDSVANNATAHYLHNMFYVLGESIEKSAWPEKVKTELYRANEIENYDTAATRVYTKDGVELLYLATHASKEQINPIFCYEFENATVYYDQDKDNQIVAKFKDGSEKVYGNPFAGGYNKIWVMMDVVQGKGSYICGIEAALPHVNCINEMQKTEILDFPEELLELKKDKEGKETAVYLRGLTQVMRECYENWHLPHEAGVYWAKAGE